MGTVYVACICTAKRPAPSLRRMILNLEPNGTLRMAGARGTTLEVLAGRVWITEAGRRGDAFIARGSRYDVAGDGVVLVGAEERARIDLSRPRRGWLRRWLEARDAARHLEQLSGHRLRDLGLTRDQIRDIV
jgi:uncharacterized protein YjiS (DUF1127 family)